MHDLTAAPAAKGRPYRDLAAQFGDPDGWFRSKIDRRFEDFERPARSVFTFGPRSLVPVPALEPVDDGKSYRLTAELPGLSKQDVGISVVDGARSISGGNKVEEKRKNNGFLHSGRRYGAFQPQIRLSADVGPDGIKARLTDCVPTVTLAKGEKATARTHKIVIEKA